MKLNILSALKNIKPVDIDYFYKDKTEIKDNAKDYLEILDNNDIKCFYHFTSRENLDSIVENDGLISWSSLEDMGQDIPEAGGSDFSRKLDVKYGLHDYVHLSFCEDHPMIYRLQQQGVQLVLLKISKYIAVHKSALFCDMNATDNNHSVGPSISDLQQIDFYATKQRYVRRDSPYFKTHQAELLIKQHVPAKFILNLDNPIIL